MEIFGNNLGRRGFTQQHFSAGNHGSGLVSSKKSGTGFTFIEVMVVIGIMSVLVLTMAPTYSSIRGTTFLDDEAQRLADALRSQQTKSITAQDGTYHAVYVEASPSRYTLYGGSYQDQPYELRHTVTLSASTRILFSRLTGSITDEFSQPLSTSIVLSLGGASKTITVDRGGRISLQ